MHLHDPALGADDVPQRPAKCVPVVFPDRGYDHRGDGFLREDVRRVVFAADAAFHHRNLRPELSKLDHREHGEDLEVGQLAFLFLLGFQYDLCGLRVDLAVRRESGGWIEMDASFVVAGVQRERADDDALGDGVHVRGLVRRGVVPGCAEDPGEEAHGAPFALGARDVDGLEPRAPSVAIELRLFPEVRLPQRLEQAIDPSEVVRVGVGLVHLERRGQQPELFIAGQPRLLVVLIRREERVDVHHAVVI